MNRKKIFLFMILAMIFMLIVGSSMSYAKTEYVVGLKAVRNYPGHENSGTDTLQADRIAYAYAINDKIIWKLLEYEGATINVDQTVEPDTGTANWNNTIYCLKAGLGFTNVDSEGGLTAIEEEKIRILYRFSELMTVQDVITTVSSKLKETRAMPYQSLLKMALSADRNNAVLWILDNSYMMNIADENTKAEMKKYLFSNMLAYINDTNNTLPEGLVEMLTITDSLKLENIILTDNDIDVIQQAAIWYHTNNDEPAYNYELPLIKLSEQAVPNTQTYVNMESAIGAETELTGEGNKRSAQAQALYYYLTRASEKAAGNYAAIRDLKPTIQLEKQNANIEMQENSTIIGPFTYNVSTNEKNVYGYTSSVQIQKIGDTEYSNIENYTLVKADKKTEATIEELNGEEFYIVIPETQITKAKLKINATYLETQATIWMAEDPETTEEQKEQPIVIVEKTEPEISDEEEVTADLEFDLALRKYITAVNGTDLSTEDTRIPNINTSVLSTETTAEYKHRKDPIEVKTGDKVTYAITIYNEGEIPGRATEIIDQLPDGLKFNQIISGNYDAEEIENNQVKFTAKEPADSQESETFMLQPYTGGELDSETILIECEVTEKQSTDTKILTNVAWISADTNAENIEDRDSQPENSPVDKNIPDYIGNTNNKPELDDSNYHYEGEQDDDDFEKLILPGLSFDLALRKFIVSVNGVELTGTNSREPVVDTTPLKDGTETTTAIYTHSKTPVSVKKGDIVIYTIRVYNEGELAGYVEELTDYLPEGLGYLVSHKLNTENRWLIPDNAEAIKLRDIPEATNNLDIQDFEEEFVTSLGDVDVVVGKTELKTDKLAYRELETDNLIAAYDGGDTLAYKDVQIACVVVSDSLESKELKNIAEITKAKDEDGNDMNQEGDDRDSTPDTVIPEEYPTDGNIQDDDDYEDLVLTYFDLALRKFITKVNGIEEEVSRAPIARPDDEKKIEYEHTKEPVKVRHDDLVTYTLRIFNEGTIAGYAEEIKDLIPEGLQFVADNETNQAYGWRMYKIVDGEEVETDDETEATIIRTNYLSRENGENNLIEAFDGIEHISEEGNYYLPDYKDIEVVLRVIEPSTSERVLRNIAEISEDADENGDDINDVDSTPDNYPDEDGNRNEDDVDYDDVVLTYFDLALRKFITEIRTGEVIEKIEDRIPQVSYEDEEIHYTHPKDPILVTNGSNITYTIRVYNEGKMAGYAKEITDDIPDGLTFLPEDSTNQEYRWIMIDVEGNETDNVEEAVKITTDYLSKEQEETEGENLIQPFDKNAEISENNPDYRDVKVVFKVTEEKLPEDRIIINTAEISDDSDEDGRDVEDEDSTPDNNEEGEDDIDEEAVKVKYFDLSLLKYVSRIIVTEDGKTTVTETGYNGLENPEPIPKVEIKHNKLNSTTVKFAYTIKITNEGEIEGYATEISDDIPTGLQFIAEDNPQWTERDGKIYTRALENTLLQPGESATVEVIFTWINDKDNMGEKTNTAEISEDYNDYGSPDIDSTPGNEEEGEDDIDIAKVILSIKTGRENIIPILIGTTIILAILSGGVFLIKKYVI